MNFIEKLQGLVQASGKPVEQIAKEADVSKPFMYQLLKGTTTVSKATLDRILAALGYDPKTAPLDSVQAGHIGLVYDLYVQARREDEKSKQVRTITDTSDMVEYIITQALRAPANTDESVV